MLTRPPPATASPHAVTATLAIACTAVCFGLVPGFARQLQALGLPDAAIAFYRYAGAALVLVPFLPLARSKRRQAAVMFGAGLLMGLGWIGYLHLVGTATIAAAGVIYMSYPLFALLFAWLLLGLRPGVRGWAAAAAVLAAAALMAGGTGGPDLRMILLALPAPATFGLGIVVISALLPDLRPLERMATGLLGSMAGLAPLILATEPAALIPQGAAVWPMLLGLCLVTAVVPQMIYVLAAPHVGPARTAATGAVELPVMIALGWLAFGEAIGPREILAAGLVLGAVALAPAIDMRRPAPVADAAKRAG